MTRFQRLRVRLRLHWRHVPTYRVAWNYGAVDEYCWCDRKIWRTT